jgi:hypothetical protein
MTFVKGQAKLGGRTKGTANKSTSKLKDDILTIVSKSFETIEADLEEMDKKDKINFVLKMVEYVLPKQREQKIDFNSLSDEEIDELINKLKA